VRILVSGASGLIGSALTTQLRAGGHEVRTLVRRSPRPAEGEYRWSPGTGGLQADVLDGVDAVVNLSGAGIGARRWNESYKAELRSSRLGPTSLLAEAMAARAERPAVFVSASAVGWYGSRGDEVLTESSAGGEGFLAEVCREWEAATAPAEAAGIRVVHLRSGVVLSPDDGALRQQLPLFRLGLGGRLGTGRQWLSWISLADEVAAIEWLLTAEVAGAVNATAPAPVTNDEFTRALADTLHRPAVLRVPRFAPSLLLGAELVDTLLYSGQRVLPAVLESSGFSFAHRELAPALRALLGP
jgi:hypothetical protein